MIVLRNEYLSVAVEPLGAELKSIKDARGREWLWQGDPAYWKGRAPILFPVVGRSVDSMVRIGGRSFPMASHGFARNSAFSVVSSSDVRCLWRLSESDATLVHYPFRFQLDIAYALDGNALIATAAVTNTGNSVMPFSIGFHPAFVWPLPDCGGLPHRCWLDKDEEPRTRRLDADGLLQPDPEPSMFQKGQLALDHRLFDRDAVILDSLRSRKVTFGVPGACEVAMSFDGFVQFGLWTKTKPDAPYLCLEPWHGLSAERHAGPDLEKRPGIMVLAAQDKKSFTMRVELTGNSQASQK